MTAEGFGCIIVATGICGISLVCGGVLCAVAWIGDWLLNREERETRD